MAFAENTSVPIDRTQAEIKRLVLANGAVAYGQMEDVARAVIAFEMRGRRVRFHLPLPSSEEMQRTRGRRAAADRQAQELRRRWRALLLVIKAKLEAVASQIRSFEQEFLGDIVMPNGQTIAEWAHPQIEALYNGSQMQPMLPGIGEPTTNG
jgi:hypothetical protein